MTSTLDKSSELGYHSSAMTETETKPRPHKYDAFVSQTASGQVNALLDHRFVGTFSTMKDALRALSQRMTRERYHPPVWEVTTTGGPARLVPLEVK